jgi:hypothetical protein
MDESRAHVELYHQAGFYKTPMAYPRNKKKTLPSRQKQWRRLDDGSEGHIEVHAAGMVSISNLQGRLYAKSDANTSWNPTRDVWGHGNSSTLHVEEIKNKF